jgi:hypothetical protein
MRRWIGCLIAASLIGCGDDPGPPDVSVTLAAHWSTTPATREALGFTFEISLRQRTVSNRCPDLPASARFTVDGQEVTPLTRDADTGCLFVEVSRGPTLEWEDHPITVRYEAGGGLVAEALYERLTPGTSAVLAVPADGQARAGDEILVVPPPELPTSSPSYPSFYPLDPSADATWLPSGLYALEPAVRLGDGIHTKVPPMTGRIALVFASQPWAPDPMVSSCRGFAYCGAVPSGFVGPVFLTVQP